MPDAHAADLIPALDRLVRLLSTASHDQWVWALNYLTLNSGAPVELVVTHPRDHQAAIEKYAAAIIGRVQVGMASDRLTTRIETRRGLEAAQREIGEMLAWIRRVEALDRVVGR